jgi:DNA repair protein RecN (Recombination protein N)
VLTGETGAGKSLLMDSIGLALGGRADSDLVRTGAARAHVNMTADLKGQKLLSARLRELGAELEDGMLYVDREVSAEGRSTCRIGGKLAPVSMLRQIGSLLVDLHGQHDHQSLLSSERHLEFLDAWIGEPAQKCLASVAVAFEKAETLRRKLAALQTGMRDRVQRMDMLRFQIEEIEAASPQTGEITAITERMGRIQHAEKLTTACQTALAKLDGEESGAVESLGTAVRALEQVAKLDDGLNPPLEGLSSVLFSLQDAVTDLRRYTELFEFDPGELESLAERQDVLKRIFRKYGDDEAQVLATLAANVQELQDLENADQNADELSAQVLAAEQELNAAAAALTKLRTQKSAEFAKVVQSEISELAMPNAIFQVSIEQKSVGPDGADQVEFFFSANKGESPKPLAKIASGGELSRVMLALKVSLAGCAGTPTLIFDEVDAGLSGRAAAIVASKLQSLAQNYQVVVISHLPQIAGRATTHFTIEKVEVGKRTITQVRELTGEERVAEIARLLAGESVGASALANARELISAS